MDLIVSLWNGLSDWRDWEKDYYVISTIFLLLSAIAIVLNGRSRSWLKRNFWDPICKIVQVLGSMLIRFFDTFIVWYKLGAIYSDFIIPATRLDEIKPAIVQFSFQLGTNTKFIDLIDRDPKKALRKIGVKLRQSGGSWKVIGLSKNLSYSSKSREIVVEGVNFLSDVNSFLDDTGAENEIEFIPRKYILGVPFKKYPLRGEYPIGVVGGKVYRRGDENKADYVSRVSQLNNEDSGEFLNKNELIKKIRFYKMVLEVKEALFQRKSNQIKIRVTGEGCNSDQLQVQPNPFEREPFSIAEIQTELSLGYSSEEKKIIERLTAELSEKVPPLKNRKNKFKRPRLAEDIPFHEKGKVKLIEAWGIAPVSVTIKMSDGSEHSGDLARNDFNNLNQRNFVSLRTDGKTLQLSTHNIIYVQNNSAGSGRYQNTGIAI